MDARLPRRVQGAASPPAPRQAGVELRRGLRFRNATDGLIALQRGYPSGDDRLDQRVQGAGELPLADRHRRERRLRHGRRGDPPLRRRRAPDRRRSRQPGARTGLGEQRAAPRRSPRRRSSPRPRSAPPRCPASSSPSRGPGSIPSARASSSPRTSGACGARGASAPAPRRASARELQVPRDRLVGLAPARRQAVGDRQQRDVDLDRLAGDEVAVDGAAVERPLVDEEAEAQVMARERRDVGAQALAGAQAREDLARHLGALAVVAGEADARRRRTSRACAAWRCRAAARPSAARRRASARRRAARPAARDTAPARSAQHGAGSRSSAIACSSTSSVWSWTSRWW